MKSLGKIIMARENAYKVAVLKITAGNTVIVNSRNAKQEICPCNKNALMHNVNGTLIKDNETTKLRSIIGTKDDINIEALRHSFSQNEVCKVFSLLQFCSNERPPEGTFVEDSLEIDNGITIYRPILDMVVTGFSAKATTDGDQVWKLELEEP